MSKKIIMVSINRKNIISPTHYESVNVPKKAKIMGIEVLYDTDTNILFEVEEEEDVYEKRSFLAIKVGELLADNIKKKYIGTAVIQKGHIVEQVYELFDI